MLGPVVQSMMELIDSHCHLDALEFEADRLDVRQAARLLGVSACVIPAVEKANFQAVKKLAHQTKDFYALGIHPLCTPQCKEGDLEDLRQEIQASLNDLRLVAVGEIGLDAWVSTLNWPLQLHYYKSQLKLAKHFQLPVILHVRKSADDLLKGLREIQVSGGIAHAFTGSLQQAQKFIDMGFCLGFGGAISFDRANRLRTMLKHLPLSAIVLETDSPDIAPKWIYVQAKDRANGHLQARNDPTHLPQIAQVVADIKGIDLKDLAFISSQNVHRVFSRMQEQKISNSHKT
ncbi:MAG: TatD family hydrolase [Betaproteobacteria bacterium]